MHHSHICPVPSHMTIYDIQAWRKIANAICEEQQHCSYYITQLSNMCAAYSQNSVIGLKPLDGSVTQRISLPV